jgi:hypothetical protein
MDYGSTQQEGAKPPLKFYPSLTYPGAPKGAQSLLNFVHLSKALSQQQAFKRGAAPLLSPPPLRQRSLVLKVVIPVKTGIYKCIARHDFWIPTYVGMIKRLKNGTYDTKPRQRRGGHRG